jgi:ketosteroid isomerase-like protein
MAMGLCNAPSTFQRLMDKVLHGLIGTICYVYMDDIIIFSENEEDHFKHLEQIMQRLESQFENFKEEK